MESFRDVPLAGLQSLHEHVDGIIPANLDDWLAWTEGEDTDFPYSFGYQLGVIIRSPWRGWAD